MTAACGYRIPMGLGGSASQTCALPAGHDGPHSPALPSAAQKQELCTSCMKRIKPGQERCKTPQCDTDLRDSNNRIPASWIGHA